MSTVATDATPPRHASRPPTRWLILAVICLAQLTVLLDNTILSVAIPSLTEELGASTADVQWMINAYSLVQSGLLLTAGNAADRYGRKRMLVTGLALFGVGSVAASFSQGPGQLIAARAGMGVGGALLMTTTLAVVVQVFDGAERPRAIGIWSTVNSLGFAAGPVIGGTLLNHFWWGSIFLINVPVVLVGLVAAVKLVPESREPAGERPDPLGTLLSVVGMAGVVYSIIAGPVHGWWSTPVLGTAGLGLAGLAVFAWWERRVQHPMLDMGFFRNRRFIGALAGGILVAFGMGGSLFLLTQQLQFVLGYGPLDAGLRTAPLALTVVVLNFTGLHARVLPRLGTPLTIALGMTTLAAGLATAAVFGSGGYGGMLSGLMLMGIGVAFAAPTMANAVMSAIPPRQAGVGAGLNGTLAEFGNGLGVAVLGAVLGARFTALLPATITGAASLPAALAAAHTSADQSAVRHAFASGLRTGQLVGSVAVLLGGLIAALLLHRAARVPARR
ncbi:MFS transporter [Streptomyces sp. RPT161]|uniref:MFS transporter n=1 Tax=Streptomyces sp. RPT161 TaxID=3015993 RepID=UPI0022B88EDF|nr:MFS transporter [Streptomyces sp. RPT161]